MLFILFCNFLLVLDGSGPPREINSSSSSSGGASVAGAGEGASAGSATELPPRNSCSSVCFGKSRCHRGVRQHLEPSPNPRRFRGASRAVIRAHKELGGSEVDQNLGRQTVLSALPLWISSVGSVTLD